MVYFILSSLIITLLMVDNKAQAETYQQHLQQNLGVAFEFKIHVDPGKEDCYYQMIESGASFYASFHVLRGGDTNAGFYIANPEGTTVMPYQWKQHSEFDVSEVPKGGYYALCIDNKPSAYQSKLVSLYVASFKRDEWDKYIQELSENDVSGQNATRILRNLDNNLNEVMRYLENTKAQHSHDIYLAESNNNYVQQWSILQCIVIIICGFVQVYFVKKLFQEGGSKGFGGLSGLSTSTGYKVKA